MLTTSGRWNILPISKIEQTFETLSAYSSSVGYTMLSLFFLDILNYRTFDTSCWTSIFWIIEISIYHIEHRYLELSNFRYIIWNIDILNYRNCDKSYRTSIFWIIEVAISRIEHPVPSQHLLGGPTMLMLNETFHTSRKQITIYVLCK